MTRIFVFSTLCLWDVNTGIMLSASKSSHVISLGFCEFYIRRIAIFHGLNPYLSMFWYAYNSRDLDLICFLAFNISITIVLSGMFSFSRKIPNPIILEKFFKVLRSVQNHEDHFDFNGIFVVCRFKTFRRLFRSLCYQIQKCYKV